MLAVGLQCYDCVQLGCIGAFVNTPVVLVLTTLPNSGATMVLAQQVIDARLAACVTYLGVVKSRYWWNGNVEAAQAL
jgi:periplasmic divalent cation tolerance protein